MPQGRAIFDNFLICIILNVLKLDRFVHCEEFCVLDLFLDSLTGRLPNFKKFLKNQFKDPPPHPPKQALPPRISSNGPKKEETWVSGTSTSMWLAVISRCLFFGLVVQGSQSGGGGCLTDKFLTFIERISPKFQKKN